MVIEELVEEVNGLGNWYPDLVYQWGVETMYPRYGFTRDYDKVTLLMQESEGAPWHPTDKWPRIILQAMHWFMQENQEVFFRGAPGAPDFSTDLGDGQ